MNWLWLRVHRVFFQLLLSRSFNILSVDLHVIVPEVVGSILQSVQSDRMSLYLCVWRNQTLTIRYWYRFDQNIIRPNTKDRLFVKTVCELHQPTRVSLNNIVLVKRSPWNSDQSTSWINHCINKLCWHNFFKKSTFPYTPCARARPCVNNGRDARAGQKFSCAATVANYWTRLDLFYINSQKSVTALKK